MKIVACVPFWLEYDKNNSVYMKKLAGKFLINYTLETLQKVKLIDEIIIFCSNDEILNYITTDKKVSFFKRSTSLDDYNVSIEDIIDSFIDNKKDADVIILIHPNCPFIKKETIEECVTNILNNNNDSAYTAVKFQKFGWMDGKRLNYSKDKPTPNKNNILPIILEQGSVYIFKKNDFIKNKNRIGTNPFIKFINLFEGHEVVDKEDYEIAELIINSGMNME
ncbi:hypothetical protein SDC9_24026 [bioreactor metagenome]|uniref:3-deoxy-manno-octulosonate cytidylyltransferase n=1 Tax=bioreactor metagenome TaxID=1076179 RepID=A0A644UH40_9ZZZZ